MKVKLHSIIQCNIRYFNVNNGLINDSSYDGAYLYITPQTLPPIIPSSNNWTYIPFTDVPSSNILLFPQTSICTKIDKMNTSNTLFHLFSYSYSSFKILIYCTHSSTH